MAESQVYEYSLSSGGNELTLKMCIYQDNIMLSILYENGKRYLAFVKAEQLKEVCQAFVRTKTLSEILTILHNTIEAGNISLNEDENGSIEFKFAIKLASGNYPAFSIFLDLEESNSLKAKKEEKLPPKVDNKGKAGAKQEKVDSAGSKYSLKTVPSKNANSNSKGSDKKKGKKADKNSQYSTLSVPSQPTVYTGQNYVNYSQNNNIIEYSPNIYNGNQYQTCSYSYVQPTQDYNQLFNQNNYSNSFNYSNYYQSDNQYQTGYYTQNSYDLNQLYQGQNQYQTYDYQPQNYQYQTNIYSNSYPSQFDQAFAEVIPLNPINEFLQSQAPKAQEQVSKKDEPPKKNKKNEEEKSKEKKGNIQKENANQAKKESEKKAKKENENKENSNTKEKNVNTKKEENKENEKEENKENEKEENKENEKEENKENEEEEEYEEEYEEIEDDNEEQENKENDEAIDKKEENAQNGEEENDIETLYRTEEGLIIFRNGILKGIIKKYLEIDNVVTKIQDIIAKGAKFTLLYKATTHGDNASVFHEKCDNHQMTLVLIETDKGVRFGGFTTKTWEGHCIKKVDNNAFVFSIDKNKIFDVILDEPAIGCYPKFGPVFFGCQIRIYNNCFTKGGSTCYSGLNYKTANDFELNNGEQTYIVKDIEVYEIEPIDV